VLRRACADLQLWQGAGLSVPAVAVNVSAHQVMGPAFAHAIERILSNLALDPGALHLEVAESVLLADTHRAVDVLRQVKELGVSLSLDDFGTGYSSLGYLRQFPFDIVKIDRSFVAQVPDDAVTRSIVIAMIELSHALDLTVTAEGVESERELTDVVSLGADRAQGFHLSRPLTASQLAQYVSGRT